MSVQKTTIIKIQKNSELMNRFNNNESLSSDELKMVSETSAALDFYKNTVLPYADTLRSFADKEASESFTFSYKETETECDTINIVVTSSIDSVNYNFATAEMSEYSDDEIENLEILSSTNYGELLIDTFTDNIEKYGSSIKFREIMTYIDELNLCESQVLVFDSEFMKSKGEMKPYGYGTHFLDGEVKELSFINNNPDKKWILATHYFQCYTIENIAGDKFPDFAKKSSSVIDFAKNASFRAIDVDTSLGNTQLINLASIFNHDTTEEVCDDSEARTNYIIQEEREFTAVQVVEHIMLGTEVIKRFDDFNLELCELAGRKYSDFASGNISFYSFFYSEEGELLEIYFDRDEETMRNNKIMITYKK